MLMEKASVKVSCKGLEKGLKKVLERGPVKDLQTLRKTNQTFRKNFINSQRIVTVY